MYHSHTRHFTDLERDCITAIITQMQNFGDFLVEWPWLNMLVAKDLTKVVKVDRDNARRKLKSGGDNSTAIVCSVFAVKHRKSEEEYLKLIESEMG